MARKKKGDPISGWINLDKPYGMTSTQAVGKIRRLLNAQKIGHAGTLDPLATGILPIALGEATKTIQFIQDDLKTYRFSVTWGEQRDTDDMEGDVIATNDHRPNQDDILSALPTFTGEISQTPPRFSAIKINGERAYDLARDGEEFEIKSRTVFIKNLTLIEARENEADFEMICGKGTYVRSLARDLALQLGTVGFVSTLRRTKVGFFNTDNAISLDKIDESDYVAARAHLLPLENVLDDIPALSLTADEYKRLHHGQALSFIAKPDFNRLEAIGLIEDEMIALAMFDNKPIAIVERSLGEIKPIRVFNL